jgi:hypothetical protein
VTAADQRFAEGLAAEYAAIYAYGVIGAHLGPQVALAQSAEAAHRARRDALVLRLSAQGVNPPAAPAAYALPFPVVDPASALKLATTVEDRCAAVWRQALPDTAGEARQAALDALIDCATRGTTFRKVAGGTPLTLNFPGTP